MNTSVSGKKRVFNRICVVLLIIALFFTSLASIICSILDYTLFDSSYYTKNILTVEYYNSLKSQIDNLFYGQGVSRLFTTISDTQLEELKSTISYDGYSEGSVCICSASLMSSIVNKLSTGKSFQTIKYSNSKLKDAVLKVVSEIAVSQNFERTDDELKEAANTVYDELCTLISEKINILTYKYWNHLPNLSMIYTASNFTFPIVFVASALILLLFFTLKKHHSIGDSFYFTILPLWISSLGVLSITLILKFHDIPSKISTSVLTAISPLIKIFVTNILDDFSGVLLSVSIPMCAILTVGMILSIVFAKPKNKYKY